MATTLSIKDPFLKLSSYLAAGFLRAMTEEKVVTKQQLHDGLPRTANYKLNMHSAA
jgi:hypothetical protein